MPVPERDLQYLNRNIYIPGIWILLKTCLDKLGYILKLVTLGYTPNCNVSWIYKTQRLATIISYSPLGTFFYYFTNLSFFGEKWNLPRFFKNKQNSNPYLLCKVGKIQLPLIKTTCLLLQIKLVIIKTFNFKHEHVSFTKLAKHILLRRYVTNKIIINLKWRKCNILF